MVNSTKDRDTSMALVRAILLPNDVVALIEKTSDTIGDLLVMQQVHVTVVTSMCFKLHFRYLIFLCFYFTKPLRSSCLLGPHERAVKRA